MPAVGSRAASTLNVAVTSDLEIVLTRVFDAPRELVFEAHSRPEHVSRWWGLLRGFTPVAYQMDFRPGGAWRFAQRAPDGTEHAFRGEYREIVPPERIVYTFEYEGHPGHVSVETLRFDEKGGRTTLTSSVRFDSVEDRDAMLGSGMEAGAAETLDRLADHLRAQPATPREIVAERVFAAPRDLVFRMWGDPADLAHWWGPRGFSITTERMDFRTGGEWVFQMHGPDGRDYPNRFEYVEVVAPERIVYDHVSGPPFHASATFADADGGTRVTVRMLFASAELRDRVQQEFGAAEGLVQTLDRLGERLAELRR